MNVGVMCNWGVLKEDIIGVVKEFFKTCVMPEDANNTSIVPIPKVFNMIKLPEYRPISMCNVVYNVV
jgi:hypothetical protein